MNIILDVGGAGGGGGGARRARTRSRRLPVPPRLMGRQPVAGGGGDAGVGGTLITLRLANVPLAEALRYTTSCPVEVQGGALRGEGGSLTTPVDEMFTNVYVVPPTFLSTDAGGGGGGGGGGAAAADPFADPAAAGGGAAIQAVVPPSRFSKQRGLPSLARQARFTTQERPS